MKVIKKSIIVIFMVFMSAGSATADIESLTESIFLDVPSKINYEKGNVLTNNIEFDGCNVHIYTLDRERSGEFTDMDAKFNFKASVKRIGLSPNKYTGIDILISLHNESVTSKYYDGNKAKIEHQNYIALYFGNDERIAKKIYLKLKKLKKLCR